MNRKLIRPNLAEIKERMSKSPASGGEAAARESHAPRRVSRPAPTELTNAEAFYYLKQMNTQTPMVVVLNDGEELRGQIEWYDRGCLKVHREGEPNVLIYKHAIKLLYKVEDETQETDH